MGFYDNFKSSTDYYLPKPPKPEKEIREPRSPREYREPKPKIDTTGYEPIPGFEDNYLIDTEGRIISLLSHKILTPSVNSKGYLTISLMKNGIACKKQVHILVAQTYLPNPDNLPVVNHKDGNTLHPAVSNVEWATYSENTQHAHDTGLISKTSDKPVDKWNKECTQIIQHYKSVTEAMQLNKGASKSGISQVCSGSRSTHIGYAWKFSEED